MRILRRVGPAAIALAVLLALPSTAAAEPDPSLSEETGGLSSTGSSCPEGTGVTVVIDNNGVDDNTELLLACQPADSGSAMDAIAASAKVENAEGGGFICTIDGKPADGDCMNAGFWSLWTMDDGEWQMAQVGAGNIEAAEGLVIGLSWASLADPDQMASPPNIDRDELNNEAAPAGRTLVSTESGDEDSESGLSVEIVIALAILAVLIIVAVIVVVQRRRSAAAAALVAGTEQNPNTETTADTSTSQAAGTDVGRNAQEPEPTGEASIADSRETHGSGLDSSSNDSSGSGDSRSDNFSSDSGSDNSNSDSSSSE